MTVREARMSQHVVPSRITIDFRDEVLASRTWILGSAKPSARADLLAFEGAQERAYPPLPEREAFAAPCMCPEFCEHDHANE
jgi:hypothetical protein